MNGKNNKGKSLDVKDLVVRGIKPLWIFLILFVSYFLLTFVGIFLMIPMMTLISALFLWIVLGYLFYIMYKFHKRAKRLSFVNHRKTTRWIALTVSLYLIGIFLLIYLRIIVDISSDLFAVIQYGFMLVVIIPLALVRKLNSGSIVEWYNNIIVRHGREISAVEDGYTERPYTMKLFDPSRIQDWNQKLDEYRNYMLDKVLIAGHERIGNGYNLYLPSPTLQSGIMGVKKDMQQSSRVTVYDDGSISVYVSRYDYERIGLEVTYHELCQRVLNSFASSMKSFMRGNKKEAVEILGGKGYIEKRKRFVRQTSLFHLRMGVVAMVSFYIFSVGVFHGNVATMEGDFANIGDELQFEMGATMSMGLPFDRLPTIGDEMAASFTANTTIPKAYVYRIDHGREYMDEIIENATSGEFSFTAPVMDLYYLVFEFENETGYIVPATVHIKIEHLNGYSSLNLIVPLVLVSVYAVVEFMLWRRREGLS